MGSSTHLKDMKDSIEIRPPGSNRGFILLGVENARDRISSVRLDGASLDLCHDPAIESVVSKLGTVSISASFDSRCQLINCLEHGTTQLIRFSAVQSPVKRSTDIGTVQS